MIDAHIHLERGPYEEGWLDRFIDMAVKRNMDEIFLLEHTHRFFEFKDIYMNNIVSDGMTGDYQREWISRKMEKSIGEYTAFINRMRNKEFPVEVRFGLEVCYFPGEELRIKRLLEMFDWDFLTGSVHWIDGWGFDHEGTRDSWRQKDVDGAYRRYYEIMKDLIRSGMFTNLAHPDSIKCFDYYAGYDLTETYREIAELLVSRNMSAEFNLGLYLNYNHGEFGLNSRMLRAFKERGVRMLTATDAHRPEDAGLYIKDAEMVLSL
ncbi:MAG: hypothetical protein HPY66_2319 [Firmicutes bacterium]|nr:hypothetical protein [Bacillota bacterium]MDI6705990.1 histidinol-phosphatase HisJ family protein [Bacillota bacterium]